MSRLALALVFVAAACGSKTKDPPSPAAMCERGCKKILGCVAANDGDRETCIQQCTQGTAPPPLDKIEKLEAMSCDEITSGGASALFGGGAAPPAGAAPANAPAGNPPAGNGCTADCRGCVSDGSSCYAAAGGANGIPCEPCCCAPGGPAPTWKTED